VADGVKYVLTGTPNFLVSHIVFLILFADGLSPMPNDPKHMQTMLNNLGVYAQRKPLTVN